MAKYLSCAETAKLIRAALKKTFPCVKFSVRSKTYSGGASVTVHWTDGPTAKQVDAQKFLIDQVRGHTFLKNYLNSRGKVVDLGMNKGEFARTINSRYGCSVAGVEANPDLAANIADLGGGITCKNAAIAAHDGSVKFSINKENVAVRASSLLMVDGLRPRLPATSRWLQPSARITISVARSSAVKCSQLVPIATPCQKGVALGY